MKRILALLLAVVMVLCVAACGKKDGDSATTTAPETTAEVPETTEAQADALETANAVLESTEGFRVGYARVDITPEKSVPLGGFGNTSKRMSTNILRRIYMTAVAIADENDNLAILVAVDLKESDKLMEARSVVSLQLGIPTANILVNASHSHAAPDVANGSEPNILEYIEQISVDFYDVCLEAVADLKPAELAIGSVETEGLNFVKHYQYTTADGTVEYFGDNFGTAVYDETTTHTTEIDQTMHVIQITREGAKDIVMTNWRAHPLLDGSSSKTNLSSDYIGAFREAMELRMDCNFVFFQGAAGNNNSTTRLASERRTTDTAEYGNLLADYALDCLANNMKSVESGEIQIRNTMLEAEVNHDTDSLYYAALTVQSVWTSTNSTTEAKAVGAPYGIRSPYMANAIVTRYNMAATLTSEMCAIAIGDSVAFAASPNELYDSLSVMLEEQSPYEMTMYLGYCNKYTGYIPSAYGFEYTSYESDVCRFKAGIGETMVECMVSMLKDMASN